MQSVYGTCFLVPAIYCLVIVLASDGALAIGTRAPST